MDLTIEELKEGYSEYIKKYKNYENEVNFNKEFKNDLKEAISLIETHGNIVDEIRRCEQQIRIAKTNENIFKTNLEEKEQLLNKLEKLNAIKEYLEINNISDINSKEEQLKILKEEKNKLEENIAEISENKNDAYAILSNIRIICEEKKDNIQQHLKKGLERNNEAKNNIKPLIMDMKKIEQELDLYKKYDKYLTNEQKEKIKKLKLKQGQICQQFLSLVPSEYKITDELTSEKMLNEYYIPYTTTINEELINRQIDELQNIIDEMEKNTVQSDEKLEEKDAILVEEKNELEQKVKIEPKTDEVKEELISFDYEKPLQFKDIKSEENEDDFYGLLLKYEDVENQIESYGRLSQVSSYEQREKIEHLQNKLSTLKQKLKKQIPNIGKIITSKINADIKEENKKEVEDSMYDKETMSTVQQILDEKNMEELLSSQNNQPAPNDFIEQYLFGNIDINDKPIVPELPQYQSQGNIVQNPITGERKIELDPETFKLMESVIKKSSNSETNNLKPLKYIKQNNNVSTDTNKSKQSELKAIKSYLEAIDNTIDKKVKRKVPNEKHQNKLKRVLKKIGDFFFESENVEELKNERTK